MRHKVFAVSLSQTRPKRNGVRRVTHLRPLLSDDKDPTRAFSRNSPSETYTILASRIPASSPNSVPVGVLIQEYERPSHLCSHFESWRKGQLLPRVAFRGEAER